MTKITIVLYNAGGELDRQTIPYDPPLSNMSADILQALQVWALAPGDVIKILDTGE
jgi:hypothetical protein